MEKIFEILQDAAGEKLPLDRLLTVPVDMSDPGVIEKFLEILKNVYENRMPFNQVLGVRIELITMEKVIVRIEKKPELVGNFEMNILHGGVISAVIDLTGGIIIQANALRKMGNITIGDVFSNFVKMSTVDMRVDYLRPGFGDHFICTSSLVRIGNKVAATRMEFYNDKNQLLATGAGTYLVG